MSKREPHRDQPRVRCAIYTRKSSEEGLEQEFNSLDAQREACAAYIKSQRHAGWIASPDSYDDGGLSGGTMERPALQRLLADVRAGKVHVIVVYKVDRLTRALADFAKIVDVLDGHGASFVSVTQHFNTTTSMGRLTLNVLLSFAQFEREIAGERIRDKIAASKRKGMWMGGNVPLGYDVQDRKLIVNTTEAETVRHIFRRYAELGSVSALQLELDRDGIVSKRRKDASGRCTGGKPIARGALYLMLQNRIYRGEIVHKGDAHPGEHDAIIDEELWNSVARRLEANRRERELGVGVDEPSLLAGLLRDSTGERMTPTHAVKAGKRYRYYVSQSLVTRARRPDSAAGRRVPAGDIEALVLDRLRQFFASSSEVGDVLSRFDLDAPTELAALQRASGLGQSWPERRAGDNRTLALSLIEAVVIHDLHVELHLKRSGVLKALQLDGAKASKIPAKEDLFELRIGVQLKRTGRGVRLIVGDEAHPPDEGLIRLMARAFDAREQLLSGRYSSIDDMARQTNASGTYLTTLVRLTYLAPDIVRAILDGRQPLDLSLTRLMTSTKALPHGWADQRRYLGFPTP